MKVAIIAYGHPDNVLCLSHYLAHYIDVTLIFVAGGDRFTKSIFDWDITKLNYGITSSQHIVKEYVGERIMKFIHPRLKIMIVRTPTLKILKDWKRENVKYISSVASYIRNGQYDLIHFNGSSGFQLYFHFLLKKEPKVYTIHDYLPHSGEGTLKSRIVNRLQNKFYTRHDYDFIQHYHFLRRKFADYYRVPLHRVHSIYCGPLEVYRLFDRDHAREEPHTILFFGRISAYKGIDYLIRAVPIIKKRIPDLKVIIAGKGHLSSDKIGSSSIEVHNHHISNESLVHYIKQASLVVVPYTDATHSAVVMTAYAFTKPVVATTVGGIPEVVEDDVTGRLVRARDHDALARAVVDLLEDREKRAAMKRNIDRLSKCGKLSWHQIAKQTIGVYNKVIASHPV
ncbi:MAG: glycosyltransferase family 4 protein [candidate division WOR-3 bacterium]|nr:MAG: glycosyltransferase family 4 protein [candidate division WOR-3 bacterium]